MYIAVDVGGTKTLVAVYNSKGELLVEDKRPTNKNYTSFIDELVDHVNEISVGHEKVKAIGVAVPGHVEDDNNIVKGFGNLEWKNKDIYGDLSEKFNVPVIIDNDANMGALGEANMGAGQDFRKVLYVTLSTGIGTGMTIDGNISPALKESEGGAMLLDHDKHLGSWENIASGKAFHEKYGQLGKDVEDPKVWKEYADSVAEGMQVLASILQPDVIVIGGSMGVHYHKFQEFLDEILNSEASAVVDHPPIVQADEPERAVIKGCYVAASRLVKK